MHELDRMPGPRNGVCGGHVLSREDGEAAIRAVRRGVAQSDVGRKLGVGYNGLKNALGTWAIHHADVPPAEGRVLPTPPEGE